MPILECPGVFEVVLPVGWTARGAGDREYDITPDGGPDVAITITVFPKAPRNAESFLAARSFAKRLGVAEADNLKIVTPRERRQQRSFLHVTVDGNRWFIACLFFKHGYVLATVNAPTDDQAVFAVAETIVSSIAPI